MKKIMIIASDKRFVYLKDRMINNENIALTEKIADADYIILGFLKYDEKFIEDYSIEEIINSSSKIIIGKANNVFKALANKANKKYYELVTQDEFVYQNAVLTAQAILKIILETEDMLLSNANILVTGYGRCGKIIADMLKKFGACVYVEARKSKDLCLAEALGFIPIHLNDLAKNTADMDIIINTVPHIIFTADVLDKTNCEIYDIASAPGGVDYVYAHEIGLKAKLYPKLPGIHYPLSAGEIVYQSIKNIIKMEE